MRHTVHVSVQDVLLMVYLQQHTAGLQHQLQHVLLLEHQHVPIVVKLRVLLKIVAIILDLLFMEERPLYIPNIVVAEQQLVLLILTIKTVAFNIVLLLVPQSKRTTSLVFVDIILRAQAIL